MKRILIALFLGTASLAAAEGDPPEAPAIKQQTCPVMHGNKINPELFVEQDGKRIYVCCKGCVAAVKKDFDKYWPAVEAEIAAAAKTWTCSMHPDVKATEPGKCPTCKMDLVPVEPEDKEK